jgi:hypothetical protein
MRWLGDILKVRMVKLVETFVIPLALTIVLVASSTTVVLAAGPPPIPQDIWGNVTINGSAAPTGLSITVLYTSQNNAFLS